MDERDAIIEEVFGREFTGHPAYRDVMQAMDLAVEAERRRVTREIEAKRRPAPEGLRAYPDALGEARSNFNHGLDAALAVVSRGVPEQEERDVSYLPMDCPKCGRHRLEAETIRDGDRTFVRRVQCEKCRAHWPDEHPPLVEPWDGVPEQEETT